MESKGSKSNSRENVNNKSIKSIRVDLSDVKEIRLSNNEKMWNYEENGKQFLIFAVLACKVFSLRAVVI